MGDGGYNPDLVPRLCHIVRWPEFNGYGFNLHAEKGKAGQFIGKVDEGSPAEAAGLKAGDRIVEVNGTNIGNENHQQVVGRIKSGGEETRLLVVDQETDQHYKENKKVVRGDLPEVKFLTAARDDEENQIGTATNGMNGGSVGEAAVVSQTSEAQPAVIHSTTTTTTITTGGAADGDLNLNLSAAEMKERLKMRKKQDPRHSKTSFETKYKMFEKM